MGLFDEADRLRARRGRDVRLPRLRLSSPAYAKDTRSGKPEAILKVTSYVRGHRVKNVLEYIARAKEKDDLELETEGGEIKRGKADIKAIYENWCQDFERKKPGGKREPRHAVHIVLHAKVANDPTNAYKVNAAARDFLKKEFGEQGYEYVFATHLDKQHPHVHVVVKNYNRTLNAKLRIGKRDLFELRRSFAAELQRQGIEHVATLRMDRPLGPRELQEQIERLKKREKWYESRLRKAPGGADLLDERKRLARAVVYAKRAVKEATLPMSPTRRAAMQELRVLDTKLIQVTPEQFRREAATSIEKLRQEGKQLEKALGRWKELEQKAGERKTPTHTARLRRRRFVECYAERYERDLAATAAEIRKSTTLGGAEKQAMLKIVQEQGKAFQALTRGGRTL